MQAKTFFISEKFWSLLCYVLGNETLYIRQKIFLKIFSYLIAELNNPQAIAPVLPPSKGNLKEWEYILFGQKIMTVTVDRKLDIISDL